MNTELFILFVMAPLFTAVVLFALGKHRITQRCISLGVVIGLWIFSIAALIYVLQNGIVVLRMGNWQAPYGIILVADVLGMTMVTLNMTIALAVTLFSLPTVDVKRQCRAGQRHVFRHWRIPRSRWDHAGDYSDYC